MQKPEGRQPQKVMVLADTSSLQEKGEAVECRTVNRDGKEVACRADMQCLHTRDSGAKLFLENGGLLPGKLALPCRGGGSN